MFHSNCSREGIANWIYIILIFLVSQIKGLDMWGEGDGVYKK
jgi:hypothetical protein